MTLEVTREEVIEMATLAVIASIPMGMRFLHHNAGLKIEDVREMLVAQFKNSHSMYIEYFSGRMMKFRAQQVTPGVWAFNDSINTEYQSWGVKYSGYEALLVAVREAKK